MASVIDHPGYFTSLPRDYYVSEEIFEAELDLVFARQWLHVGHASQIPAPGDFFACSVGPESLLIVRDAEGEVRSFFNVCRHRGAQLCESGTVGQQKAFVCPYHRWSYGLDGRLLGAPGSRDGVDFDFAGWGLHEARCATYFGSIYVYLDEDAAQAPAFHDAVAPLVDEEQLARVQAHRIELAHQVRYEVRANWKLVLENNCECYHCAGAHPSLGVSCDYSGFFAPRDSDLEGFNADKGYFPLREGMQTFSMDGRWVSRKPLGAGFEAGFSAGFILVPMFAASVYFADHGVHLDVFPIDKDTTEIVCQWYVHEDAVEGEDYEVDRLIGVFDVTNREDVALAELTQRGVRSRRFVPGPNSPTRESFVKGALSQYLAMMGRQVD